MMTKENIDQFNNGGSNGENCGGVGYSLAILMVVNFVRQMLNSIIYLLPNQPYHAQRQASL